MSNKTKYCVEFCCFQKATLFRVRECVSEREIGGEKVRGREKENEKLNDHHQISTAISYGFDHNIN